MGSTRGLHALRNRIPCLKRMLHYCGDEGVLSPLAEAAACHHLFYPCKPPPPALISPDDNLQEH